MTKPSVIVFFTDQQRWDTSGLHGNPLGLMENFDRIATRGTHVFNSFTCQPVCGPARASLQTGLYSTKTGCYRNHLALPSEHKTLAHYFKEAGYATAYIGKWHLGSGDPVREHERGGYDYWLGSNLLEFVSSSYDTVLFDNDNNSVNLPGYRVDALTDAAIRYIHAQDDLFFLFISMIEPHHQNHLDDYPPPVGYREKYTGCWMPPDLAALGGSAHQHLAGYYGMVKRLDEAYGRLMDALISKKRLDETILLFTSDHGNNFKTRNAEYKRSCHESSIRVPTALHGGIFNQGGCVQQLVSTPDLTATLLDVAEIEIPEIFDGRSILPLLRKETVDWPEEIFIQISESQVGRAIRTKRWKYSVSSNESDAWNESYALKYREEFLYDTLHDPYELCNLAGFNSHREIADQLKSRLIAKIGEVEKMDVEIENASVVKDPGQRGASPGAAVPNY